MKRVILIFCFVVLTGSILSLPVCAEDREQTLQTLLAEAGSAQARGEYAVAAEAYRKSVAIDPTIPELWANLGLMYHETGKHAEAIQCFKRAEQLRPSLFVPQLFLGIEYLAAQDPNRAIPFLKSATRLNPNDRQAALSLGKAYSMLQRGSQAAEAYWNATRLNPNDGDAWIGLGTAYLQQVEIDARLMTSVYKESAYAKLRAAEIFAEQGKLIEAESAYKAALDSRPPAVCAHAEFGVTLLRLKKWDAARRQFELEEKSVTRCGLAQIGSAIELITQGNVDLGLGQLSSIGAHDPDFIKSALPIFRNVLSEDQALSLGRVIGVRQSSGMLSPEIGRLIEKALISDDVPMMDNSIEVQARSATRPNSAVDAEHLAAAGQYTACKGALLDHSDRLTSAEQKLLASCSFLAGDSRTTATAAQFLKTNPKTMVQGLYWESKADQELAISALTRADEIAPNSPQMKILIGDVFRQKRRWSEAETEYRKAVALDPSSRSARLSLAIVLFTELRNDEAFDIDKGILAEIPGDPEANLLAGEILVQQHEFGQAEAYLEKCRDLNADFQPRLHVLLGQVYAETGRTLDAISEYKMGLSSDQDGRVHYQLARLYQKIGNITAASREIQLSKQLRQRWDNSAHVAFEQRSTDISRQ